MNIQEILADKAIQAKGKVTALGDGLLDQQISCNEIIKIANISNDANKGTCVEALELATRKNPRLAQQVLFDFATEALSDKAPRVRWEAAKVIGNIASLFPTKLGKVIPKLLINTEYSGTVVRWAAAFALGEIIKLCTKYNKDLLPAIETILIREENNAIKKIYEKALKKVQKSSH
jgi:hypothetical protein